MQVVQNALPGSLLPTLPSQTELTKLNGKKGLFCP